MIRRGLGLAAACSAAYLLLGFCVSGRPPAALDRLAEAAAGHALGLAAFLTAAGLFPVYAVLCVLVLGVGLVRRAWLLRASVAVVALFSAWRLGDAFKAYFARPRPARWYAHHESSFSYASGHATLALTFYGFWAYVAWTSGLPLAVRRAAVAVPALWIAATGWSRLALGAHYASDVLGGYLLGGAMLGLAVAAYERLSGGNGIPARQKSSQSIRGKSL